MRRAVALLAAALALAGVAGCGGSGAEPGAPIGATLVLDFTPNAVHSGIYAAQAEGFYEDAGVDLTVQVPGESTDAPKLLAAGRAEFAILDITDLGLAREKGLPLVGIEPIVQRPLAAILARGDRGIDSPKDLEGQVGRRHRAALRRSRGRLRGDGGGRRPGRGQAGDDRLQRGHLAGGRQGRRGDRILERRGGGAARGRGPDPDLQSRRIRRPALSRAGPDDDRGRAARSNPTSSPTSSPRPVAATSSSRATRPRRSKTCSPPTRPRAGRTAGQLKVLLPALEPEPFDPHVLRAWAAWALAHGLLPKSST